MQEQELPQLHEWGLRVSRLLELIALTNQTLKLHEAQQGSQGQIRDYRALLAQHKSELDELMQTYGLSIQINPLESAA
ncbi:hypothetical protein DYBT9623_04096 [Dyadobacter sp. CECT 9623]|uniref:Uncharacterized protein n=1 Tax=Dyadobacter linearis TaxID=2823330 RepID=A0ABN7RIN0_9BACT|nr:hypothetical protein [Dyadobacter sp. CECT 9623]CAG5072266.1 hypothetical protein DYBT9623_04096 [Dyadobacter sp. CECT 9623]